MVPLADALVIRKDMNDCIRGMVDNLPEIYRNSMVLSDIAGLTSAEIAGVLGISVDAVKIRLHRARTRLRAEMEQNCAFYRDSRNELACDRKPPSERPTVPVVSIPSSAPSLSVNWSGVRPLPPDPEEREDERLLPALPRQGV